MYRINTSYQAKLLSFVETSVTQILEGLHGENNFFAPKLKTHNLKDIDIDRYRMCYFEWNTKSLTAFERWSEIFKFEVNVVS
jgi:hypothetical protein